MIRISHQTAVNDQKATKLAQQSLDGLLSRKDVGFFKLPHRAELWKGCEEQATQVKSKKIVVLGIGGSSLGGIALIQALQVSDVYFFENVDAKDFFWRLQGLGDLKSVHWVIVSKSGKTIETLTQANFVHQILIEKGIALRQNCTVVTEETQNPLHSWAIENRVPCLSVPLDVGGRFSVLSPVGMFVAAAAGVKIKDVCRGAQWGLENKELVTNLVAQSLMSFQRQEWVTVFWPYCTGLRTFGLWCQQLWAESLAKRETKDGGPAPRVSTPLPLLGANDQHSVLQQLSEGARDKFILFMSVAEFINEGPRLKQTLFPSEKDVVGRTMGALLQSELEATRQALQNENVQSLTLEIEHLDGAAMGALFMVLQLVVATLGEALQINAFDQPGVELGKRLAKQILSN